MSALGVRWTNWGGRGRRRGIAPTERGHIVLRRGRPLCLPSVFGGPIGEEEGDDGASPRRGGERRSGRKRATTGHRPDGEGSISFFVGADPCVCPPCSVDRSGRKRATTGHRPDGERSISFFVGADPCVCPPCSVDRSGRKRATTGHRPYGEGSISFFVGADPCVCPPCSVDRSGRKRATTGHRPYGEGGISSFVGADPCVCPLFCWRVFQTENRQATKGHWRISRPVPLPCYSV